MNWDALGAIGELIGAAAVVGTLIYLSVQMRQNTNAVRLSSAQAVTEQLQYMFALMSSDEALAEIIVQAGNNDELSDTNRVRYNAWASNLMRAYENAFLQRQGGAIDHALWTGMTRMMIDVTKMPAFSSYWSNRKHWLSDEFQQHMESEIISTEQQPGISIPGKY